MMINAKENLSDVKNVLVDGGYSGEPLAAKIKNILGAVVTVAKLA